MNSSAVRCEACGYHPGVSAASGRESLSLSVQTGSVERVESGDSDRLLASAVSDPLADRHRSVETAGWAPLPEGVPLLTTPNRDSMRTPPSGLPPVPAALLARSRELS